MTEYEEIFADFKEGNVASFYQKMYPGLLTYTARLLGDEFSFLAEDCVQDAVFKAYQQNRSFSSHLQWKMFLYTCIRNGAVSILRKGQAQKNYVSQKADFEEDFSLGIIEQETLNLLYEAIDALPDKFKQLFELSFEQGLKNAEVAQRMQVAEITIKKQKAKLFELLRKELSHKMDTEYIYLLLFILSEEIQ